jgi:uncharacterized protein
MDREEQEERNTLISWRRIDVVGLELLALRVAADRVRAESTVICLEDGGYRLDHRWELTGDWRALSLRVERHGAGQPHQLTLERDATGWRVDGELRQDLDGAEEPDLSVTPFCNTFPIRRMLGSRAGSLTLDTAYVNGADLSVMRSRQRYDRLGPNRYRFVDLGVCAGFDAELLVDDLGIIRHYEHLFERIDPSGSDRHP